MKFYKSRAQKAALVVVDESFSDYINVRSRVPHGSVLGLVLFQLYIIDIVECIEGCDVAFKLFADDVNFVVLWIEIVMWNLSWTVLLWQ